MVESESAQLKIQRMRISCWMPKSTDTHSQYVIIIGFPLQQLLHDRPSVLRYIPLPVFFFTNTTVLPLLFYHYTFRLLTNNFLASQSIFQYPPEKHYVLVTIFSHFHPIRKGYFLILSPLNLYSSLVFIKNTFIRTEQYTT